jgi:Domain of unknown function (DUF4412)
MRKQLALAVLVPVVIAAPSLAGVYFTAVTTSQGGPGAKMADMTVKSWVDGDRARIEFAQSGNPMMKEGDYLLTKDGGKTVYLVNPKEKTFAKWDMESMLGGMGSVMKGMRGMMNMNFSNPKVERLLEENGGTILGLPTTHYRFRTSYTMEMNFMGMHRSSQTVQEQDVWATTRLSDVGLGVWLHKTPPKTGDEQLDAMIAAQRAKMVGFPLKSVTVSTVTDSKGHQQTHKTVMQVTELQKEPVAASKFEMGPGYSETQLLPEMGKPGSMGHPNKQEEENPYPFHRMMNQHGGQ